jgi:hypothetical protein
MKSAFSRVKANPIDIRQILKVKGQKPPSCQLTLATNARHSRIMVLPSFNNFYKTNLPSMKLAKKMLTMLSLTAMALLAMGCDGSLSTIDYNNTVVDILNATSDAIETTTFVYDESVPNLVTETSEIDVPAMQEAYDAAQAEMFNAASVLQLVGSNAEQQAAVSAEFSNYLELGNAYLATYKDMIGYYSDGYFATDLDGVATYDELLHYEYNDFIDSNNALVDILASYVQ